MFWMCVADLWLIKSSSSSSLAKFRRIYLAIFNSSTHLNTCQSAAMFNFLQPHVHTFETVDLVESTPCNQNRIVYKPFWATVSWFVLSADNCVKASSQTRHHQLYPSCSWIKRLQNTSDHSWKNIWSFCFLRYAPKGCEPKVEKTTIVCTRMWFILRSYVVSGCLCVFDSQGSTALWFHLCPVLDDGFPFSILNVFQHYKNHQRGTTQLHSTKMQTACTILRWRWTKNVQRCSKNTTNFTRTSNAKSRRFASSLHWKKVNSDSTNNGLSRSRRKSSKIQGRGTLWHARSEKWLANQRLWCVKGVPAKTVLHTNDDVILLKILPAVENFFQWRSHTKQSQTSQVRSEIPIDQFLPFRDKTHSG